MKSTFLLLASLVTVYSFPNPAPSPALDTYGKDIVKRPFSTYDFDSPSKLEFSETSAVAGHSDIGPKDVAAELHAKIEEAAQHALAIIDGAKTFAEEAEKEQVNICRAVSGILEIQIIYHMPYLDY